MTFEESKKQHKSVSENTRAWHFWAAWNLTAQILSFEDDIFDQSFLYLIVHEIGRTRLCKVFRNEPS